MEIFPLQNTFERIDIRPRSAEPTTTCAGSANLHINVNNQSEALKYKRRHLFMIWYKENGTLKFKNNII